MSTTPPARSATLTIPITDPPGQRPLTLELVKSEVWLTFGSADVGLSMDEARRVAAWLIAVGTDAAKEER